MRQARSIRAIRGVVYGIAAYLIYKAGMSAEFDYLVRRAKNSEKHDIYTYMPNGDCMHVTYHEAKDERP